MGYTYRSFLILITVFSIYQIVFFYVINPYYLKKIFDDEADEEELHAVAFEVVYLLEFIFGMAVAPLMEIQPFLLWGVVLLIYGIAIKRTKQSFFMAAALLYKPYRKLSLKKQFEKQENIIVFISLISSAVFIVLSFFI